MPTLDLLQLLALACVVAGVVIVAWGFLSGRLRVQGRRGAGVLLAFILFASAVARDTVLDTDSSATIMITMAIVFVWGRYLVPSRGGVGADA